MKFRPKLDHLTCSGIPRLRLSEINGFIEERPNEQFTKWSNFQGSCLNPLSPHDAIKHNFTFLKTDLIFLQLRGF